MNEQNDNKQHEPEARDEQIDSTNGDEKGDGPADLSPSALLGKFEQLHWLLHRRHHRGARDAETLFDPSRGQGRILAILKLKDGISTKDLAFLLGIRVNSLNELLVKLEKGGYVRREADVADRRVMLVVLTEKGRAAQQESFNDELFQSLSREEQETLADYLDRLIAELAEKYADDRAPERQDWWQNKARERMGDEFFAHFEHVAHRHRGGYGGHGGHGGHHHGHGGGHGDNGHHSRDHSGGGGGHHHGHGGGCHHGHHGPGGAPGLCSLLGPKPPQQGLQPGL